eukprot:5434186-Alexandrium_andersonii.AAC.1
MQYATDGSESVLTGAASHEHEHPLEGDHRRDRPLHSLPEDRAPGQARGLRGCLLRRCPGPALLGLGASAPEPRRGE